jgi:hypothetical protein
MAVTTDPFTSTDLQYTLPKILADYIVGANFPKAVFSNFFTDLSYLATEGGRTIEIPQIYTNGFTVSTQSVQGAEINTQAPPQAEQTLTINNHKYIAMIIGDADLVQIATKYQLMEKYATEIAKYLVRGLEDAIIALNTSITTNVVGTDVAALSDQSIRTAIATLEAADFDLYDGEGAFFFHPAVFWGQLGAITKYYSNNISQFNYLRTGNFGPYDRSRGLKGVLYDIPVFVSSRLPDSATIARGLLAHKSALGFALQTPPVMTDKGYSRNGVRVQMDYQLRNLGMLTVADQIYGVAALRQEAAVLIKSSDTAQA